MHADIVVCHGVEILQLVHHVVGVEYGIAACLRDAFPAQGQDISQSLDHYQEVSVEALHFADAVLWLGEVKLVTVFFYQYGRQELCQFFFAAYRACAGTASAVRR